YENADEIGAPLLAQLLRALPVDIEQHVAPRRERAFNRSARRAVAIAEYLGPFEHIASRHHGVETDAVSEIVIPTVDLAGPRLTRRRRNRQLDRGVALQQQPRQRRLARPRRR